jgi:hypothetical protein
MNYSLHFDNEGANLHKISEFRCKFSKKDADFFQFTV